MAVDTKLKQSGFSPRQVCDIAGQVVNNEGTIVSRTLLNSKCGSLSLFAFAEGQRLSEHTAPYDAFVHVLEGTAQVVIAGEKYAVGAGEVILMPANVPHAVNAPTNFKMLLTMFKAANE